MSLFRFLKVKLHQMLAKAVITAVNDAGGLQLVDVTLESGERIPNLPRPQNFGFSSVPPIGARAFVGFQNGDRSDGSVIGEVDVDTRPVNNVPGESLHFADAGNYLHMKSDGGARLKLPASYEVDVTGNIIENILGSKTVNTDGAFTHNSGGAVLISSDVSVTLEGNEISIGGVFRNSAAAGFEAIARVGDRIQLDTGELGTIIEGSDEAFLA